MNPTPMDWLLLVCLGTLCLLLMYMKHVVRELEYRTDVLERETEWLRKATVVGEVPGPYDYSIEPLTYTAPAVADDVQMLPKSVPFRFVEGDEEDPYHGLPRRYG